MNLKSGYPFPLIRIGLPFDYPKLEKNTHTEVLIIGGGISGALMAHQLTEKGIGCMVIDARSIGLGSTCASTSLLQYEIDTPLHQLCRSMGEKDAVKTYRLCAASIHALERIAKKVGLKDFRLKKSLQLAATQKDVEGLRKEFDIRKKYGFGLHFLSGPELEKEFKIRAGGALLTDLAADTDSYLFTHLLFQFDIGRGLRVFDRSAAKKFESGKNHKLITLESGITVKCRHLVFANGYEAVDQLPPGLVRLKSTFVTISESLGNSLPFWKYDALVWNTAHPYLYLRTTADRRIMVGGRDENVISPSRRDRLIPSKTRQLARDLKRIFPKIPFVPEFSWTGIFGTSDDGLPFIGKYRGHAQGFFALGFGGNGITFGQVAAEIICDMIRGRTNLDVKLFSFDRR